jgi:hypothetical protein
MGGTSRDSYKEFGCTIDLSNSPETTFPIAVPMQDVTTIKFVVIEVIGGSAVIRFVKNGAYSNSPTTVQVTAEVPTGLVDGSNNVFDLAYTPVAGTEKVYVDGVRQSTSYYTINTNSIVFHAGHIPSAAVPVIVDYYYTTGLDPVPLTTQNLDLTISGCTIFSEVDLNQLFIMSAPNGAVVEVIGSGN